jgi:hypothetical protein
MYSNYHKSIGGLNGFIKRFKETFIPLPCVYVKNWIFLN